MIDLMPQKFIPKSDLNDWSYYSNNIHNFPYVKKYLQDILKYWVENIDNPLSIPWVLALFAGEGELDNLDKTLGELEKKLGGNNLKGIFKELQDEKTKHSSNVCIKIHSLSEEIKVFLENLPIKNGKNIKKITSIGDWEYDNTIISVKSILPLEFNRQLIENTVRSMFFIKEYSILRNYYKVTIGKCGNIDDTFRRKITSFLESKLISLLNSWNYPSSERDYYKEKPVRSGYDKHTKGHLRINTYRYDSPNGKEIGITMHWDETSKKTGKSKGHHIEMIFEENIKDANYLYVAYDTDVFWLGNEIDKKHLKCSIEKRVKNFDDNYLAARNKNKNFEGWITSSVSPINENYIVGQQEAVQQWIRGVIGSKNYKIHVVLRPMARFALKGPMIFDF